MAIFNGAAGGDSFAGGGAIDVAHGNLIANAISVTLDVSSVAPGKAFNMGAGLATYAGAIDGIHHSASEDLIQLSAHWAGARGYRAVGNEILTLLSTQSEIYGQDGDDRMLRGLHHHTTDGGSGADTADYSSAAARINGSLLIPSAQNTLGDGTGTLVSTENLQGTEYDDTITGSNAADYLAGAGGDDLLTGLAGNDTLDGGSGLDTLRGGQGDDVYLIGDVADLVEEDLNSGIDEVRCSGLAGNWVLAANVENMVLLGSEEMLAQGNELSNRITGNAGNDTLYGLAGDDTLVSGTGADELRGGIGNDTYIVNQAGDTTQESVNEGTDEVQASVSWTLSLNVENLVLTGTGALTGTGNASSNLLRGNSAGNLLIGAGGADTLDGGTGADTMQGSVANDTYVVDQSGDKVIESANGGFDTVQSSVTWILGSDVEHLVLAGSAAINGTGNALNNQITGNAGANILNGGSGNDTLTGGAGNDTYGIDSVGDRVVESPGGGVDVVHASVSWILNDNCENLLLTGSAAINASGNALNNQLTGNAANNLINGNGGSDTMTGGGGNDTYGVDSASDRVIELAGGGTDTINSSVTLTLAAEVENLTLTGTASIKGFGNSLANHLNGNGGANFLFGGAGADTLAGGLGNDTYSVDSLQDLLVELPNGGSDTVESTVTWQLGDHFENLTLTGSGTANATGNAFNNYLTGNSEANYIDGGLGADTMKGGGGDDTFIVDNIGDVVVDDNVGSAGVSVIKSSVSWDLKYVHHLELTGAQAINATGSEGHDLLIGNSASNVLDGDKGIDTLVGGQGNDTYLVDHQYDVVTEQPNGGIDTVRAGINGYYFFTIPENVENLELTNACWVGYGNSLNNRITGEHPLGSEMYGGAGIDTLVGGAGNDVYGVDELGDTIIEQNGGGGTDTVVSEISWTLAAGLENLSLSGYLDTNAVGNAADNIITGNVGDNRIDGGAGADTMSGGYGNDIFIVDNLGDRVSDVIFGDVDEVQSSVSFTLSGDHLENLTLTGALAIAGTGNSLDNTIVGNSSANILTGSSGFDRLTGLGGSDTFVLNDTLASDTVTDFTSGVDKLRISQSSVKVGDGDALVESARWQYGAGGFSTQAELVIVAHDISGAITAASAAASVGSASSAYAIGQTQLFIVDNGSQAGLYFFKAANADAAVSASELTLLATLQGTSTTAVGDVIFST